MGVGGKGSRPSKENLVDFLKPVIGTKEYHANSVVEVEVYLISIVKKLD